MRRPIIPFVTVLFLASLFTSCASKSEITQAELVRRSQELFDSVAAGDQVPWKKYFAADCMYFDEKGNSMDKAALVAGIAPLPSGYSGTIKLVKAQSHIEGNVAVLSYDLDETETIFGQSMKARYHGTDTWLRRNGEWRIIAGQMLRYYEDPAPGAADTTRYRDYAGTYQLAPGNTLSVTTNGKQLYRQKAQGPVVELIPEAADIFFRKGVEGRILFRRAQNGKIDALIDRRNNEDIVWTKVS
jgi:hypothetical protein